jgi:hypothetical protein
MKPHNQSQRYHTIILRCLNGGKLLQVVVSSNIRQMHILVPLDELTVPRETVSQVLEQSVHCMKAQSTWAIGWTDGLFFGCARWTLWAGILKMVALAEPTVHRIQPSVHSVIFIKTKRFLRFSHQHQMSRHAICVCVGWMASVGFATAMWRGRAPDEPMSTKSGASVHLMVLKRTSHQSNGSMDALVYLYPFHLAIWGCWSVLKSRGEQETLKITSMPS